MDFCTRNVGLLLVLGGRSWCKLCSEVVRGDDERGVVRSLFIDWRMLLA